jgi:hypothetical protein
MSTSLETALWLIAGGTVAIVAVGVFGIWWERRDRRRNTEFLAGRAASEIEYHARLAARAREERP